MSEALLQQQIRLDLGMRDDIMLLRINVGKFRPIDGGPRVIQSAPTGTADFLGVQKKRVPREILNILQNELSEHSLLAVLEWVASISGAAFAIETKSLRGKQREGQRNWQAAWEKRGGIYILAKSLDDVYAGLGIAPHT